MTIGFLKKHLFSSLLLCFFLFISLGNFSRILSSSFSSDSLPILELGLYLLSFCSLPFLALPLRTKATLSILILGIVSSFAYGSFLHGFEWTASLYAVRLIGICVASIAIARVCYLRFAADLRLFFAFLVKAYMASVLIGYTLYTIFPASNLLWKFLSDFHILFHGDPHQGRFVSVYFDPNYYACISILAFLLCRYLWNVTKHTRYQVYSFLLLVSGILTWSRSGLAVLVAVLLYRIPFLLQKLHSRKSLCTAILSIGILLTVLAFQAQELTTLCKRTWNFFHDDSALARLNTWELGLSLWKQFPLLGIGTNFLYLYTRQEVQLNSLDSSLLSLLIQMGTIPFCIGLFYSITRLPKLLMIKVYWLRQKKVPYFFSWLCFYALCVIGFASQFNNILLYPFWIIPFSSVFLFLCYNAEEHSYEEKASSLSG